MIQKKWKVFFSKALSAQNFRVEGDKHWQMVCFPPVCQFELLGNRCCAEKCFGKWCVGKAFWGQLWSQKEKFTVSLAIAKEITEWMWSSFHFCTNLISYMFHLRKLKIREVCDFSLDYSVLKSKSKEEPFSLSVQHSPFSTSVVIFLLKISLYSCTI